MIEEILIPQHGKGIYALLKFCLREMQILNPNSIGWTQRALAKQPKNKSMSICDQKMSCGNKKKDIAEPEILDLERNGSTKKRRQDDTKSVKFPLEKTNTNSSSKNSNFQMIENRQGSPRRE